MIDQVGLRLAFIRQLFVVEWFVVAHLGFAYTSVLKTAKLGARFDLRQSEIKFWSSIEVFEFRLLECIPFVLTAKFVDVGTNVLDVRFETQVVEGPAEAFGQGGADLGEAQGVEFFKLFIDTLTQVTFISFDFGLINLISEGLGQVLTLSVPIDHV